MSDATPLIKSFADAANSLAEAVGAMANPIMDAMAELVEGINRAMLPIRARHRPYETGRELAEIVVDQDLTGAERYPVIAETDWDSDTITVAYDDGSGYEPFLKYDKEALNDA